MSSPADLTSKRRRFQAPITTFFTTTTTSTSTSSDISSSSSSNPVSHTHYAAATHSPTPVVPAKVQASLLSVGMRIRKSVAEGYKTNHSLAKMEKQMAFVERNDTIPPSTATTATTYIARAELAPFSGMGRADTAGKSAGVSPSILHPQPQPQPQSNGLDSHGYGYGYNSITTDEDESFSLPSSSQESNVSEPASLSGVPTQKKRTHADFTTYEDSDSEIEEVQFQATWNDPLRLHPVLPSSSSSSFSLSARQGRTILSPTLNHQRRRFVAAAKQRSVSMEVDDFEEPAFLRRRDEVDDEVQMGGM
ncbi:ribonucleotide reductase inhibitor-domain-containing protein [Aspergillus egyptiacus]|nr:ribonucleotide reductase inhibitor-domain-containing protein [Aspergillus egyptiacus]